MRPLFALACLFGLAAASQAQYQTSLNLSFGGGFGGNGAVSSQVVTDGFGNQFRVTTFANGQTVQQPLNVNLATAVPFVDPFASARFGGFNGGGYGAGLGFGGTFGSGYGSGLGLGVGVNRFGGYGVTGFNQLGVGFSGFNHHHNHVQAVPFGNTFLFLPRH